MIVLAFLGFAGIEFEVLLSESVAEEALDGRLVVIISQNAARDPKDQVSVTGAPLWGITMDGWAPGESVLMTDGNR